MISHKRLHLYKQQREKMQPNIGKKKHKSANKHAKENTKGATTHILKRVNK